MSIQSRPPIQFRINSPVITHWMLKSHKVQFLSQLSTCISTLLLTVREMDFGLMSQQMPLALVPSATSTSMNTSSMVWPHWPQPVLQYTTPERSSKWDICFSSDQSTHTSHTYQVLFQIMRTICTLWTLNFNRAWFHLKPISAWTLATMWKGIVLISSIRMWRYLSRLQRYLLLSRGPLSVSPQSNTLFTRTCLRHWGPQVLPISSSEAIGCTAAVNAVEPQLKSNGHRYNHHGQYHRHRQSHTGSTTFTVIPMLGVGLLLCRNSSQGDRML